MYNIVFTIDNRYIQHLCVTICSLIYHNRVSKFKFFIISPELSSDDKLNIEKTIGDEHAIEYISIKDESFRGFYISNHISLATYYRLFIPKLLPSDIHKVLFLDCDIVIKNSIDELLNFDIDGYSHASVCEPGFNRNKELGIPYELKYFNAGVLLINLKWWRQNNVSAKAINYIKQNPDKILLWDQDALNAVLYGKWKEIDPKFNLQTIMLTLEIEGSLIYKKYLADPYIIHYTGSSKPWQYSCKHPYKKEYWFYIKMTPFIDAKVQNRNFKTIVLKYLPFISILKRNYVRIV